MRKVTTLASVVSQAQSTQENLIDEVIKDAEASIAKNFRRGTALSISVSKELDKASQAEIIAVYRAAGWNAEFNVQSSGPDTGDISLILREH